MLNTYIHDSRLLGGFNNTLIGTISTTGYQFGNTAIVDIVYGNDSTASVGGSSFLTIESAISAITTGQTIWVLPGIHTLSSGITIPNGTSIRGLSVQTTIIQMNVNSTTTMITMGENCRIEDFTINIICTGSTDNIFLKGILFSGTSSQTSKIRTCVLSVNNSTMNNTLTSTVTGVEFSGTGLLSSSSFSFNSIKGTTINVYSNGQGNKRGILVSNTNQVSTRDTNIYVAQPTNTTSTGSYVGIETNDLRSQIGSIQIRSTTCGIVYPTVLQSYTASDILQTTPIIVTNPGYLTSAGIQIGTGTDLVTYSAGGKGFSAYIYPLIIYYGLKGNISRAVNNSYLWSGTQEIINGVFPDPTLPAAYFRIQQPTLIAGLFCSTNIAPGGANSITLTVYYTPVGGILTSSIFTVTISGTDTTGSFYNGSVRLSPGDYLHLQLSYTGNNANLANDITAQIDLF